MGNFLFSSIKFKIIEKADFYSLNDVNFFKFLLYSFNLKFDRKFFKSTKRFIDILFFFFGINRRVFKNILSLFGISFNFSFYNLSLIEFFFFWSYICDFFFFNNRLKFFIKSNLKLKFLNGSYIGRRLRQGLPTKGQRTKSNGKTSKKFRLNSALFEGVKKVNLKKKK